MVIVCALNSTGGKVRSDENNSIGIVVREGVINVGVVCEGVCNRGCVNKDRCACSGDQHVERRVDRHTGKVVLVEDRPLIVAVIVPYSNRLVIVCASNPTGVPVRCDENNSVGIIVREGVINVGVA